MLAYLTPNIVDTTGTTETRSLVVPVALWHYVNGALQVLTESENWQQFGDMSPDDTAQLFQTITEYV